MTRAAGPVGFDVAPCVDSRLAVPGMRCAGCIAKLESGELKVFDCATFTVEGKTLESCLADVDTDADYTPDTEVIENGAFMESKFRSAPYFQLNIDGITLLDQKF